MKQAVLSLSGGMDSSSLLLLLLAQGYKVTALSFDYGQKHKVELERAKELVEYINFSFLEKVGLDAIPKEKREHLNIINHRIITIDGLSSLLNSTLVEGGEEVPEGHYEQENMKDTVVPNRNKIFSSIIQAVALSIANKTGDECVIAMGIHAGDHAIYPDCRQDFRDMDFAAFVKGNWGAEKVNILTPYLYVNKFDILKEAENDCKKLGLDFDEVFKRTNTSYKPIRFADYEYKGIKKIGIPTFNENQNGIKLNKYKWYSDYKSAASVERIEAFIKLGRPDPVEYADETGPVTWELVKNYVQNLLDNHK